MFPQCHSKLKVSAGYSAVIVASILMLVKFLAWRFTNSIAVQVSFVDSLMDAISSAINLFAIKHSFRPANQLYRWGYGKAEALASFAQSIVITITSIHLLIEIVERIINPEPIQFSHGVIGVLGFAIPLTAVLVLFQRYVICKTHSLIIKADSLHYETDLLSNFAVILSLLFSLKFNLVYLDSIIGLCIIAYVMSSIWKIFLTSVNILMDREVESPIREKIADIIRSFTEIQEIYDMKTRSDGKKHYIQVHVGLDEDFILADVNFIVKAIKDRVQEEFDNVDIIVHHQ